ncbi:MAG: helix-turn-helix transcriptional regulator [Leptolyngbyaceae cyanobacterium RM2_2_4]|nr:helix-turn-helix transcriptional regulator [Leptolyngbyaceae cyanobacterium SM1_4_3]NJO52370.1 helix-turn-helix transcriptional regulator [Leptolyngbyaceae cyanobacterium RM2_2_4]NJO67295.1 helix-turn-helix transcriptional regulator [Leptolyngbyaceae cyanobacterium RM1_405_57]
MSEGDEPLTPVSLRKRAKKTQRQVAEALGKKVTTISDWERRKTKPQLSFSEVKQLMEFLNCTLEELIEAFEGNARQN